MMRESKAVIGAERFYDDRRREIFGHIGDVGLTGTKLDEYIQPRTVPDRPATSTMRASEEFLG